MSLDPELADAPEHPDAIAWEARHCADRLASLAEGGWGAHSDSRIYWLLWQAADSAWDAAQAIEERR